MEPVLVLFSIGAIVTALALVANQEAKRRQSMLDQWQEAAAELGLSVHQPKEHDRTLQGVLEGVPVRAELKFERQGKTHHFRSTLCAGRDGSIPPGLSVRGDSLLRSMGRLVEGRDEQIGDPEFDHQVELPGLDAYACAALSYAAREQLSRLVERGGEVRQGMVVFSQVWSRDHDRAGLVRMLRFVAQLGRLLRVTPDTLQQRLAENALRDPSRGVRLQNLRFLADPGTHTPDELLASTGRALLTDVFPPVRLLAAQLVGAEGHGVLWALAADARLELALRVLAVSALGRGPMPALAALRALLGVATSPPELACAVLSVVGQRALHPFADAARACCSSEHESVRAAAASALGALADPQAEPALIGLLSDASTEVQRASAEALGALGSVAAVEPLLPLAEGFGRPHLRQAARAAIGRIQSRLGHVEAGRISLAEDRALAGAVDLADTAAVRVGELSLAAGEASAPEGAAAELPSPAASARPR